MNDVRSFNVGASNYCKHKFQCWDYWLMFKLNPFDGDLLKRILRTKETDPRLLDYYKIKHICSERIRQLNEKQDVYDKNDYVSKELFNEMMNDYNLIHDDIDVLTIICYPSDDRIDDYNEIIQIVEKRIREIKSD